jgi:hypothetical protein
LIEDLQSNLKGKVKNPYTGLDIEDITLSDGLRDRLEKTTIRQIDYSKSEIYMMMSRSIKANESLLKFTKRQAELNVEQTYRMHMKYMMINIIDDLVQILSNSSIRKKEFHLWYGDGNITKFWSVALLMYCVGVVFSTYKKDVSVLLLAHKSVKFHALKAFNDFEDYKKGLEANGRAEFVSLAEKSQQLLDLCESRLEEESHFRKLDLNAQIVAEANSLGPMFGQEHPSQANSTGQNQGGIRIQNVEEFANIGRNLNGRHSDPGYLRQFESFLDDGYSR